MRNNARVNLVSLQIYLLKLWRTPTYKSFLYALTLCGYVSYMFGWHVHEKAVLLVLVPLRYFLSTYRLFSVISHLARSLLSAENHAVFRTFVLASVAGIYSLFPLLFTPAGEQRSGRHARREAKVETISRRNTRESCVFCPMDVFHI